jgi:steroid 5-alpha reductase family enzyme
MVPARLSPRLAGFQGDFPWCLSSHTPAPSPSPQVTDFAGSTNFILIALLTFFANGAYSARQIAITVLVCLSRLELASYLLYRVLKRGKDDRFDQVRTSFVAFLTFWVFQVS